MAALIDALPKPVIMAHRGASAHAPENTLAAFHLAMEHGADGIELDTKLTADGRVVVIHDPTVDRTTGSSGMVRQLTLEQIKNLDAGSHFDARYAGEPVPTLEEVFEALVDGSLINIEVANYASPRDGLPDAVAALVERYGMQQRVIFSSFNPFNLLSLRRRLPEVPVGLLTLPGWKGGLLRGPLGALFAPRWVHPYYTDVTEASLARAHAAGIGVNVWTVNRPEDMRRLFRMGIDGIITDDPHLARQVMEEK